MAAPASNSYAKIIKPLLYLVVIVLLNLAGLTLFFRFDLTANKIYSISPASKAVVATLSEPLTINVFFTKNLPAPHNYTERYLHDLLEEYALASNDYFNYRFYDVSPESEGTLGARENQQLAENYGIRPVQIQAFEDDEVKFKRAYMGMVLIHGDMVERIPTITSINGLEYTLTTAIQKLNNKISALLRLEDKIKVNLVLSSSLKQVAPFMGLEELPDYPAELAEIVNNLNQRSYNKLEFAHIDPTENAQADLPLPAEDLMQLKWPAIAEADIRAGEGQIGLVVSYQEKVKNLPILSVLQIPIIGTQYQLLPLAEMEEVLNRTLESLVDINTQIGYLTSHGTAPLSPGPPQGMAPQISLGNFQQLVSQTYSIQNVDLTIEGLPEGLPSLIITRPTEKFSDWDLYQIDQALMRGTNLILFPDMFQEQPNPMGMAGAPGGNFSPVDSGLEKLLAHYGVRIKQAYIMDEISHRQRLPAEMGGGEQPIYFAPLIQNRHINSQLPFMSNIKGLVALRISPLERVTDRIEAQQIEVHEVFAASEKAWEMRDNINLNPMFLAPPPEDAERGSQPLAFLLEGRFQSYFAGKPIPQRPAEADAEEDPAALEEAGAEPSESASEDPIAESDLKDETQPALDLSQIETRGTFKDQSVPAKIYIMSSAEMLGDHVLDPAGNSPNDMLIMNVLDALNDREAIAQMRSKVQEFNPLAETSPGAKTAIKALNIVGLPIAVALFGVGVWMRRMARKKRIQLQYATAK
ncbi:MAG: Gldg family protein [Desulfobacterales bacterium]